jgi:hypothetical protein
LIVSFDAGYPGDAEKAVDEFVEMLEDVLASDFIDLGSKDTNFSVKL